MRLKDLVLMYLEEQKILNRSPLTIRNTRNELNMLLAFLEQENVTFLDQLKKEKLQLYQEDLAYRLTDKGRQLSAKTRAKYLGSVRGFLHFLYESDYLVVDLSKYVVLPKQPQQLPRLIMDQEEVKKLLNAAPLQSNSGYRNRIILEILYDTGVRAAEMANITTSDLDLKSGYLTVREGKGSKDRVVPLSSRVCKMIDTYLLMIRPEMIASKKVKHLVVNRWGNKMTPTAIWAVVKRCTNQSGIRKNVTTHTLRHSCATHMLNNGAPIRHIQELLGHESLESTQIYTKVTINDLKRIHAKYHPGEKL